MAFIKDKKIPEVMQILFYNFVEILRSKHDDLIESLISGNLSADSRSNATLRHHMQAMDAKVKTGKQPFIYFQQLVDKNRNGPTKREMRKILSYMMLYTEQTHSSAAIPTVNFFEFVRAVDQAFGTRRAHEPIEDFKNRRYLSKLENGPRKAVDKHRTTIERFERKVTARMDSDSQSEHTPLFPPLAEIGYATHYKRLREHKPHTNSNYLMNLAEAICTIFPDLGKYHIAQRVVAAVWRISHATAGKLLFSRLAQVYDDDRGGSAFLAQV